MIQLLSQAPLQVEQREEGTESWVGPAELEVPFGAQVKLLGW